LAEPKLRQRIGALPGWAKLALLAALTALVVLLSKWLVLILLVVLGLWPGAIADLARVAAAGLLGN